MAALAYLNSDSIHPDALLRVADICGRRGVSEDEARRNRVAGKGPRRARPAIRGLLSVSPSTWWLWCSTGRAPAPIRVGGATMWRARDVLSFALPLANEQEG
jgi:hypothetical protein